MEREKEELQSRESKIRIAKRDKKLNLLRYITLGICLAVDTVMMFMSVGLAIYALIAWNEHDTSYWKDQFFFIGLSCFFFAVSLAGIIRTKKKKETVLSTGILMKVGVVTLFMSLLMLLDEEPSIVAFIAFFLLFLLTGVLTAYIDWVIRNRRPGMKSTIGTMLNPHPYFDLIKAKWLWDAALKEYLKLTGKRHGDLTEEDNVRIYAYAANEITYLFTWIVRRDHISKELREHLGDNVINLLKTGSVNPTEILMQYMDYTLARDDFSDELKAFADVYLLSSSLISECYSHYKCERYIFDYYNMVLKRNDSFPVKYCHDFSWEKYYHLEVVLEERLRDFIERTVIGPNYDIRKIKHSSYFGTDIKVVVQESVSDSYVEKVLKEFDELSENGFFGGISQEDGTLIKPKPVRLEIYRPKGSESAFLLLEDMTDMNDYVQSWVVRGGILLETGDYRSVENPWTFGNICRYKVKKSLRELEEKPYSFDELYEKGLIVSTKLVPDLLTGIAYNDMIKEVTVYLTPEMAEVKDMYDSQLEALFLEGMIDLYISEPYYDQTSVIPVRLMVRGFNRKTGMTVYHDSIILR